MQSKQFSVVSTDTCTDVYTTDAASGNKSVQNKTRWLCCVEWTQYSIGLKAVSYLCKSCLLPVFDNA